MTANWLSPLTSEKIRWINCLLNFITDRKNKDLRCDHGEKTISSKDTIHIDFIKYDTYINAIYEDGIMEGKWIVNYKENYSVPFKAVFGQNHRFDDKRKTSMFDISGKWKTTFSTR
ncbi:MAG: hypothetical protein IPL63_14440 [Saprospiraceae bacterium]|nr:hypothetical protein [Saprospiraceae bacterium]